MKVDYGERILKGEGIEDVLEALRSEGFNSLVLKVSDTYIPLDSLPRLTLGGKVDTKLYYVSSPPGFTSALRRVARGYYLVLRRAEMAYTPRSLTSYMLASGLVNQHTLFERLKPYSLSCLKCNSTVRTAFRVFREYRAIALPVCSRGRIWNILTVADLAHHALHVGKSQLLSSSTPVSKIAGSYIDVHELRKYEPLDSLKKYSMILLETKNSTFFFEASILRKFIEDYAGVPRNARDSS